MPNSAKHILIADDHSVVRYGMMLIIKDIFPWAKISQVSSFNETVTFLEKNKLDLIVLDINLPGGNSIEMIRQLDVKQPKIKILVFSGYEESLYANRYLKAGAKGYLHKQTSDAEIKKALLTTIAGGVYMSEGVKDLILNNLHNQEVDQNPVDILSNREFEVAKLLIDGNGITEISNALNLQMSTVSTYKNRIFEKLAVINIVQLIDKFRFWNINTSVSK